MKVKRQTCLGGVALVALVGLVGCEGMHLHDPGRLKAASEASALAKEFSADGNAVFAPMEENLDAFTAIENDILKLANEHELETFLRIVAGYKADEVAGELLDTMGTWNDNIDAFDMFEANAVQGVNAALDRRDHVAEVLTAGERRAGGATPTTVAETLDRLTARLATIEANASRFITAFDRVNGLASDAATGTNVNSLGTNVEANTALIGKWTGAAQDALDAVDKDEQLVAARALLVATIQQQVAAEHRRLSEYRRYLGEVRRLRQTFDTRERVAVCQLFTVAFYRVLPGVSDPTDLVALFERLGAEPRYTEHDYCAFAEIRDANGNLKSSPKGRADWGDGDATLSEYVAANVKRLGEHATGPQLVAGLAILAFVERPFLDGAVNQLYVERTRHTIRLSKVNAQQRADLMRDLAASLEIYEQGGIKPEEVARLALFASQVGALFYIGATN
jgi:hypothetical protein